MARGIPLRWLLLLLTLVVGLLVLVIAVRGVSDGLASAGIDVGSARGVAIMQSVAATEFVRGILAIILALFLAWPLAEAASRMFASDRLRNGDRAPGRWLTEANDLADWIDRSNRDQAWHFEGIARQRSDLARLVEAVSEGILQIDSSGRLARANRAARRLLALPDDAEGRPLAAVIRSAELRALLDRAATEDALPPAEIAFDERTLIVTARALGPGTDGARPGLAVAIADLTAVRRLESVRRDFVANASHELKTPLTSIRGYAETLQDESLSPEMRRQFLATISNNAQRLQNIVDDLLDLSRLESGTWKPSLTVVQPAASARDAWSDLEKRALERKLDFEIRAETDASALADPSALRQILANLLDNAIRHTGPGGRIETRVLPWDQPRAEAATRDRRTRYLAIEVRDTGTGIPTDALPRIFERFYRVDPARSRHEGGTGLGLSIVKHLTEAMGGSVEAESQLGKGTVVRIILPAATSGAEGPLPS